MVVVIGYCKASSSPHSARKCGTASIVFSILGIVFAVLIVIIFVVVVVLMGATLLDNPDLPVELQTWIKDVTVTIAVH